MPALSIPKILPRIQDADLEFKKYLNLLTALRERRRNEEHVRARPFEVTIDPTTTCQLACPYCEVGNGTMQRAASVLKEETHLRMIEELGDELFVIWYFSTGEPLLNKNLDRIVRATRDKEIFSTISTNLSLPLTDDRIDAILECGLSCISVSLDGASADTYVQYRRKGKFDLVVDNLRRLVRRKQALGLTFPLIEWRFLVFAHNHHELSLARAMARDWEVDLIEFFPGYAPPEPEVGEVGLMPPGTSLEPAHDGPAWRAAQGRHETTLARVLADAPYTETGQPIESLMGEKCDWLYFGSMLFPNASISPCCVSNNEPDDFGRLDDQHDFAANWNNTPFRDARASFREDGRGRGADLVCQRCPSRPSQDHQFITSLRGILRNAPDWALRVLTSAPEEFFHPIDFALMPDELGALREGRVQIGEAFPDIATRIDARDSTPDLQWIARALRPDALEAARLQNTATPTRRFGRPRWLGGRDPEPPSSLLASVPPAARNTLEEYVWRVNPMPPESTDPLLLHLGCGDNPLPGFVNIDFLPETPEVLAWDLLQSWPEPLAQAVQHGFSEDVLEHFFYDEQVYLLAQMNVALDPAGVFRVLMPSLESLVSLRQGYDPTGDYLSTHFGVQTGGDALNLGMRFGGHRWLHDDASLGHLASNCGFAATRTPCAESKVPALGGINLRDETNSLSFAQDLEKVSSVERMILQPDAIDGARSSGDLFPGQPLYEASAANVRVHYPLPAAVDPASIVVLAARSANLSQHREHNFARVLLDSDEGLAIPIDGSMRSSRHSFFLGGDAIRTRPASQPVRRISLQPGQHAGDVFSAGPLELFVRG